MPFSLKAVLVGPLPAVLELGLVRRLVVGGVQVVHPGLQAGVHDRQVLVGQGHVDDQVRLVSRGSGPPRSRSCSHPPGRCQSSASSGRRCARTRPTSGCQDDLREDLRHLGALVRHHLTDSACAYDQYVCHCVLLQASTFFAETPNRIPNRLPEYAIPVSPTPDPQVSSSVRPGSPSEIRASPAGWPSTPPARAAVPRA